MASSAGIQAGSLISLVILGTLLSPETFVNIRLLEGYIAAVSLLASFGFPTAIACGLSYRDDESGRATLASSMAMGAISALAISTVAPFAWEAFSTNGISIASGLWSLLIPLLTIASISKIALAHWYRNGQLTQVSLISVMPSVIMVPLGITLPFIAGEYGWLLARVLAEMLLLVAIVRKLPWVWRLTIQVRGAIALMSFGLASVLAQVVDRAVGIADIVLLSVLGVKPDVIAQYAMLSVLFQAASLPVGAFCVTSLSKSLQVQAGSGDLIRGRRRLVTASAVAHVLLSTAALGVYHIPGVRAGFMGGITNGAIILILASFILRGILMAIGAILYSEVQPWRGLWINLLGACIFFIVALYCYPMNPLLAVCGGMCTGLTVRTVVGLAVGYRYLRLQS